MHSFVLQSWQLTHCDTPYQMSSSEQLAASGYWIHCDRSSTEFEQWLIDEGIDDSIRESLLASDTRPRFQQIDENSFFLILRGVNLNKGKDPDDMLTIRLLYTPQRVITCNQQRSRAIESIANDFHKGQGPDSMEMLVVTLLAQLHAKIDSVIEPIEHFIEDQDGEIFTPEQISEINTQHRKLLRLNRFLKPQLFALSALVKNKLTAFDAFDVYLATQLDTLQRIVDTIDFYIAQIDVINQRIAHINSEVMNRNTYLLSIIAGIFLPLGFLTGLFGINIGGMPGVDNNNAFYWFSGILFGMVLFEIYLFRRLKFL
jgi:zinc transporter